MQRLAETSVAWLKHRSAATRTEWRRQRLRDQPFFGKSTIGEEDRDGWTIRLRSVQPNGDVVAVATRVPDLSILPDACE